MDNCVINVTIYFHCLERGKRPYGSTLYIHLYIDSTIDHQEKPDIVYVAPLLRQPGPRRGVNA